MQRFKTLVATTLIGLSGLIAIGSAPVAALSLPAGGTVIVADTVSKNDACAGLDQLNSSQTCGSGAGQSSVTTIVRAIVMILSLIVGIAAVIMIIIAGFRYITSGGDSNSISAAKNTLIYAIIGLVIVVLAQFLVHFVIVSVKT